MLEDLSKTALRRVIKHYNAHVGIRNFYKKSKEELIQVIKEKMTFENGQLTLKNEPYKFDIPQPKPRAKKTKKQIKMFSYDETEIDKIKNEIAKDDEEVKNIMENIRTMKPKEMTIIPKSKKPNVIIEEEKPMTENETILNEWTDKFLGTIISSTKIGKNISNLINQKNRKGHYVDDVGLISFLKPITNKIVETYGVDELFKGIDKIAYYFDVDNYNKTFGTMKYLPIKDYFNVKNLKMIQQRNKELYEKLLKPKKKEMTILPKSKKFFPLF